MVKKVSIGVDVGGTNTAIGIVDKDGNVLDKISIPTTKYSQAEEYFKYVADNINELIVKQGEVEVVGIGMGAPNGNFYRGTIEYAPNLAFKGVVQVVELLRKHFTYKHIYLTNDANAAAIGEMVYGGARGMKDFIMITLGTGVGSGVVCNGKMVYGFQGFAGELGHTNLFPEGRRCGCQQEGCVEAYCSASGIKKTLFEIVIKDNLQSLLMNKAYNDITSKDIYDAAVVGDEAALKTFSLTADRLGKAIASFIAFSEPQAVFLFGGPVQAGDLLMKPLKEAIRKYCLPIFRDKVEIRVSQLKSGDAAIVGASALVWSEL